MSQGIAECSGSKTLDFADADRRARDNLGRMINVQVKSEVISILKDTGGTGGSSRMGQITSEHMSDVLLKNSQIFSHWLDRDSCTIYAGARISQSDIDRAMREAKAAEQRKFVNQPWSLQVTGEHSESIRNQLSQTMSELGASIQAAGQDKSGLLLTGELAEVSLQSNRQLARVSLKLQVHDSNSVIWSRQVAGKGVSFGGDSEDVLITKAVQDALNNANDDLQKLMQESVK